MRMMSSRQLARDLRFVAADLGCALVQVGVAGVAVVGSWVARRRQTVVSDRAQAILDAERLAADEQDREVWEPDELWRPDGPSALVWPEVKNAAAETGGLDICARHGSAFPAGSVCRVCDPCPENTLHLDGTVTPLTSAQHPSAGRAGGPEAVSGQPPASGNPNAAGELLDHIESLIYEHEMFPRVESRGVECLGAGCTWVGPHRLAHSAHVAELISAMVAADTRVNNALKGTR